jgi:hypothetical protein
MIENLGFALSGAWQVLLVGVLLGAGLPMFFAFGIRGVAAASGGAAEVPPRRPNPWGWAVAVVCFAVVVIAVVVGILVIVAPGFGMTVSFTTGFPTLIEKH